MVYYKSFAHTHTHTVEQRRYLQHLHHTIRRRTKDCIEKCLGSNSFIEHYKIKIEPFFKIYLVLHTQ